VNDSSFAAVDRLSARIINSLHGLLGVSYSDRFEHFVYHSSVAFSSGAAGTTQSTIIRISQEAAFFCTAIRILARNAPSAAAPGLAIGFQQVIGATGDQSVPDASVLVQITDGGNDRLLHSEPCDAGLVYGTTGNSPNNLAKPKLFKPNSAVTISMTSLKSFTASSTTVRVALLGFKVYRGDGATSMTIRGA
jgi:hypothetical protein